MLLEEGENVFIQHMHSGQRQLADVESPPGKARIAVNDRLHINTPHTLEGANEEGIDRHQITGSFVRL